MSGKDITNLQDSFSKQQEKITALKKLVRKTEDAHGKSTLSAQEKVKNIAQRLTHLKSKARSRQERETTTLETTPLTIANAVKEQELPVQHVQSNISTVSTSSSSSNAGSDKIKLMRAQMEQNKARMAQRASSKQHLEQLVTQLKEKFDSTQQSLEDTFELGRSMNDISNISVYSTNVAADRYKSATELSVAQPFSLERERIKFLENRCRLLEKQLDKERQNNAIPSYEASEVDGKRLKELENKIVELEAALTESRLNEHDNKQLQNESESLRAQLKQLQENLQDDNGANDLSYENERLRAENKAQRENLAELTNKMQALETELNDKELELQQLQQTTDSTQQLQEQTMITTEMAKQIQQLQEELQKVKTENADLQQQIAEHEQLKLSNNQDENVTEQMLKLQSTIEAQRADLTQRTEALRKCEEELMEKTIELNVLNANFKVLEEKLQASLKSKPLFVNAVNAGVTSGTGDSTENSSLCMEIEQLKQKLDEANKAMIKMKLKCKQAEKQNEKLKKSSDLHGEVVRLQQQIIELEDEKGQWQLLQMQKDDSNAADETIRLLQTQNYELQQKLQSQSNAEQTQRVKCEISEIQLEEQLQQESLDKQQLQTELQQKQLDMERLQQKANELQLQKDEMDKKLEHYLSENMELLDKLEKLSKSSSSAESIEIVERLTQQERAEIDEFQQHLEQHHSGDVAATAKAHVSELTQTEMCPELNDNLLKLREESAELVNKIELFSNERREVLEKMEALTSENQDLMRRIEEVLEQKDMLETNMLLSEQQKNQLELKLQEVNKEKQILATQSQLSQGLSSMQQTSEVVAALDKAESAMLFDKCEKSLSKLNLELEAYRKANNKDSKFNVSKKLAKEAKNAHTQLSELLVKVKEASNAVETVTVVETVVAVTASNGKALAEYEQLSKQNRELNATVEQLQKQLQLMRDNMELEDEVECLQLQPQEASAQAEMETEAEAELNTELQTIMEDLREQLVKSSTACSEKSQENKQLLEECQRLQLHIDELNAQLSLLNNNYTLLQRELAEMSDNFDKQHNDTEMKYECQVEHLTHAKKMLEAKCETYLSENEILQTLIKEQKQQLIETMKENEHEMNMKLLELQQRDEELTELKETLKQVTRNDESEQGLREALKVSKKLVAEQVNELSNKQDTIETLNQQLMDLYRTMEENANKIVEQNDEIKQLEEQLALNNAELQHLRSDNEQQKAVVDKLLNELHSHRANAQQLPLLEEQLRSREQTNVELDDRVKELQQRNKEQIEKLKKYAANLKKRTVQCQELECKVEQLEKGALEAMQSKEAGNQIDDELQQQNMRLKEENVELKQQSQDWREQYELMQARTSALHAQNEQLQQALEEKQQQLVNAITETTALQQAAQQTDLKQLTLKFEKSKVIIKERNNQIQRLQQQLQTMTPSADNDEHKELKLAHEQLSNQYANEKANFEQTIARLETLHDGIQAKLQEDMSYIENLEQENAEFKQKICKLEEAVHNFEERRASMERRANLLNAEIQTSTLEHEKAEDELIQRLQLLSQHDDVIAERLASAQEDNKELQQQLNQLQLQYAELNSKYAQLQREQELQQQQLNTQAQTEQQSLRAEVNALQQELQRQRVSYDAKLAVKVTELDELECELSDHIEKVNADKRQLLEQLEKSNDENIKLKDELVRTQETLNATEQQKSEYERDVNWLRLQQADVQQDQLELQELRMQSIQDKTELDNLRQQIDTLADNHELELQSVRTQMQQDKNEMDNLRFQLESLKANHEAELQTLRDQIAELDNMRMRVGQNQTDDQAFIESENKRLTDLLAEKQQLLDYFQQQRMEEHDVLNLLEIKRELEQKLAESQQEVQQLRTTRVANDNTGAAAAPAANLFFNLDATAPTAFDEIIQMRNVNPLEGAVQSHQQPPPTIEDLQRNVSDLEKHAQDMENKLAQRMQRDAEHEEQLRELQQQLQAAQMQHNEQQQIIVNLQEELHSLQAERQALQDELQQRQQQCADLNRALDDEKHLKAIASTLESQIITQPDVTDNVIRQKVVPSLDMFFGASNTDASTLFAPAEISNVPVEEELIVPKKSYICHPSEQERAAAMAELNLDLDTNWGDEAWNEETAATATAVPSTAPTQQQLQQLQERAEFAEEQRQQMQLKINKLMKKLKEYKTKLEEEQKRARKSSSVESTAATATAPAASSNAFFDDLNAAIEDELKAQIAKLESNLANVQMERDKLLERVDMLVAGNERLTEMKERQDNDLKNYQDRVRQLQNELSKLSEWGAADNNSSGSNSIAVQSTDASADLQPQLTQLNAELQELNDERQELQQQLEAEQANTARAEKSIKQLQQQLLSVESSEKSKYHDLKLQHQQLQQTYDSLRESSESNNEQQQQQIESLCHNVSRLEQQIAQQSAPVSSNTSDELKLQTISNENSQLRTQRNEYESQIANLQAEIAQLQAKVDANNIDKTQLATEIEQLQTKVDANNIDKTQIESLQQQIAQLQAELDAANVDKTQIVKLQTEIARLQSQNAANVDTEELNAQLLEKESEILHLKQRIEDLMREDHTEKLVLEILTKNQEIHLLKMQVKNLEEDKQELQTNLTMQTTKEQSDSTQSQQSDAELIRLQAQMAALQQEKSDMEQELHELNNHVMKSLNLEDKLKAAALELDTKNIEIVELRNTLKTLQLATEAKEEAKDANDSTANETQINFIELNAQWEAIVEQKCGEIATLWREHLAQREKEFKSRETQLSEQVDQLRAELQIKIKATDGKQQQHILATSTGGSTTPVSESSGSVSANSSAEASPLRSNIMSNTEDDALMIEKMQAALESQEMEIVTLKEQLAIRSAEYARLAAQYDPFKLQTTLSHSGVSTPMQNQSATVVSGVTDNAVVPKSKLDLALYMLHQRDMRCEEMTVELVSLLEERDTLQIKLSNTLRQVEAMKSQTTNAVEATAASSDLNTGLSTMSSINEELSGTTSNVATDELMQKLSQLQTVSHSKDKVIKEEREQRIRQMEKMHQDVANMPTAAVSELVGADLSQSGQSSSTALLNWLWGSKPTNTIDGGAAD